MKALVADIGGTRIKLGLVQDRELKRSCVIESRSQEGLQRQLPRIADAFQQLCMDSGLQTTECDGVGFAFPSVIDPATNRILDAYGKFPDAPGMDLTAWATQQFGLPAVVENDARLALLGEWIAGAGEGCNDLVMVTLGTGIGSAALVRGHLVRGRHGQAAILGGHITVRHDGELCVCGNRGCPETETSLPALQQRAQQHPQFGQSTLRSLPPGGIDYATIFEQARLGDACACALRTHSIDVWSAVLVTLIHMFDPDRVVVGGGISESASHLMPELEKRVRALAHTPWGAVELRPARLGNFSALIGAAVLVEEAVLGGANFKLQ